MYVSMTYMGVYIYNYNNTKCNTRWWRYKNNYILQADKQETS